MRPQVEVDAVDLLAEEGGIGDGDGADGAVGDSRIEREAVDVVPRRVLAGDVGLEGGRVGGGGGESSHDGACNDRSHHVEPEPPHWPTLLGHSRGQQTNLFDRHATASPRLFEATPSQIRHPLAGANGDEGGNETGEPFPSDVVHLASANGPAPGSRAWPPVSGAASMVGEGELSMSSRCHTQKTAANNTPR